MDDSADIVIIGAGIAGVAAAYHLAVRHRVARVTIVDEREPLTLTSDKGTAAYRNWWPGPDATMLRYMSRSIDLLEEMAEESGNAFRLSRRGYLFVTGTEDGVDRLRETAVAVSGLGMGQLRTHPGWRQVPYNSHRRRGISRAPNRRGPAAGRRGAPRLSLSHQGRSWGVARSTRGLGQSGGPRLVVARARFECGRAFRS